jgi:hypothetical protein
MMTLAALAVSLWVNACIDGTLHGEPTTICRELQIRAYPDVAACEKAHDKAVDEWLNGLKPYGIDLHLLGSRCGPAGRGEGDDV